ncbi:MAG: FkbM family methyltransferase [Saprospiraceae bacterium]|nr:FkbM family methyltransferase [Saprospiraceae bacterium]
MIKKKLIEMLDYFRHVKSYSQDGEDVVLLSFFESLKGYTGFYVDVGAHHPVRFSNTLAFYRKGWKGINIDPTPGSMRPFKWLRARDINLEIGIGSQKSELTFFCFNEPALNTFDAKLAAERNSGNPYKIIKTVSVPVLPLRVVLENHLPKGQHIDFLSVDVEGLDLEVLKSNDWVKFRPAYVLVEDLFVDIKSLEESEVYRFLSQNGYKLIAVLKRTYIYVQD